MGRATDITVDTHVSGRERRASRRTKMSRNVLICPSDSRYSEEVQATLNLSRGGLYFITPSKHYHLGMRLNVVSGYVPNDPCNSTSSGEIVRIDKRKDGKLGIAVRILLA